MKEFEELIRVRETLVDGVGPWYWLKADNGAWDGPKTDWEESHKLRWLSPVKDKTICVQAGGCQGMYPRVLSKYFTEVYTFEPDSISFHVLTMNCQIERIHKYNAALGREPGFIGLNRASQDNVGMNTTEGDGPIPIMTIDQFEFPTCGLIALDVEGYETNIIKGALKTIDRCSPVITCECATQEIIDLLKPLGYQKVDQSVSDSVFVRLV